MANPLEDRDIEIFRAGDYGDKGVFTRAHLDEMVANFNPAVHEPPNVIGHPEADAPAHGWLASVRRSGDVLVGRLKQVPQVFADAVEAGTYKKRSVAFYKTAKGYMVRHLGWLGAQPPQVKGLADVKFSDEGKGEVVEITFQEDAMSEPNEKKIAESVIDYFKGVFAGKGAAEAKTFSEDDVKALVASAVVDAVKPIQAAQAVRDLEFAEHAKRVAVQGTSHRCAEAIARVKAKGAWVPAFDVMGLPLVFAELAKATDLVEFGEGATKKKETPLEVLTVFLEGLGKIVPSARVYAAGDAAATARASARKYPANADQNSIQLAELSHARAKEKRLTFGEALREVVAEQPELALPGGSTAGAV